MRSGPWKFRSAIDRFPGKGGWSYVRVPAKITVAAKCKGFVSIHAVVDGREYDRSLIPIGDGSHMIVISRAMQRELGKMLGDTLEVTVRLANGPHQPVLPEELAVMLDIEAHLRPKWDALGRGQQRNYCMWIDTAKTDVTRAKRTAEVLRRLEES